MTRPVFCAIASDSHLASAVQALRGVSAFGTPVDVVLLRVDGRVPFEAKGLRVVQIEDCVSTASLAAMQARYAIDELCFALKPFALAWLLKQGHAQAHYIDADCRVYANLSPLLADLAEADLQLTPHSLSPIPDDDRTPAALTVLRAGAFNAGYVGVSNSAAGRAFIEWWSSMTFTRAHNAADQGMCGDQRWLDLAPVLVPRLSICRRAGANVGYWNLHERALHADGECLRVNDEALLFFHFSGFDPSRPTQLSRHQNRHTVEPDSILARLLMAYRSDLVSTSITRLSSTTYANPITTMGRVWTFFASLIRRKHE